MIFLFSRQKFEPFMITGIISSFSYQIKNPASRLWRHGHMVLSNYAVLSPHWREVWAFPGRWTGIPFYQPTTQTGTTSWRIIPWWNSRPSTKKTPVYINVRPTNHFIQPTQQELLWGTKVGMVKAGMFQFKILICLLNF